MTPPERAWGSSTVKSEPRQTTPIPKDYPLGKYRGSMSNDAKGIILAILFFVGLFLLIQACGTVDSSPDTLGL